jgi:hypothetical protein
MLAKNSELNQAKVSESAVYGYPKICTIIVAGQIG